MELKRIKLKARTQGGENRSGTTGLEGTAAVTVDNSLAGRTKKFGDALRHVLPHMPNEHAELPQFFDTVEKHFTIYQVLADVRAKLLIPILSTQAKTIIGRMTSGDLMSYDKVKQFLLSKFRLTPKEYKVRFDTASKSMNETYVLFASRLGNLLSYYLRSRGIEDLETLCELLVSYKLKTCLSPGTLNYVLSLEGDDWFFPSKVASWQTPMLLTMITGMGRSRIKGTSPLTVMGWLSPYLIHPRPRVSSHHHSRMAGVEGTMASSHRRSHMAMVEETVDPITQGVVEVAPAETRSSNDAMLVNL